MPFFFVTGRRSALVTYKATFEVEADDEQAVIKVIRDLDGADGVAWRLDAEDPEGETVFDVLPIEGEE